MSAALPLPAATLLEVVVPVYNEEAALPHAIEELTEHLAGLPWSWQVTIADNASHRRHAAGGPPAGPRARSRARGVDLAGEGSRTRLEAGVV